MKIAFILVFALVVFLGCLVSNNKIAVCSSLDIGITKTELIEVLGTPIESNTTIFQHRNADAEVVAYWVTQNDYYSEPVANKTMYYFESNELAAGPIRAVVDTTTNKVIAIRCSEDGNWRVK